MTRLSLPLETPPSAAGCRLTRRRRVIFEIISTAERPLDIEEILARARRHEPRINRSTVYRFLAALRRLGASPTPADDDRDDEHAARSDGFAARGRATAQSPLRCVPERRVGCTPIKSADTTDGRLP